MRLKKPQALVRGDTIAVIRPSSRLDTANFQKTLETVRRAGFCVAVYEAVGSSRGKADSFFAAPDEWRSAEWDWAMRSPGIRAVLAARGGYGIQRTLAPFSAPKILAKIKRDWIPKIIVGYSDFTFAHQWLQNRLGWMSFHGPLVGMLNEHSIHYLLEQLLALSQRQEPWHFSKRASIGGNTKVEGILVGGNLSLLQTTGIAALPRESIILALEDVNESFYRLDRMIMNLWYAGYADHVRGIVLGTFEGCGKADAKTFQWKRVCESLKRLTSGPIVHVPVFGHGLKEQKLLPLGMRVRLQSSSLQFLESWTAS